MSIRGLRVRVPSASLVTRPPVDPERVYSVRVTGDYVGFVPRRKFGEAGGNRKDYRTSNPVDQPRPSVRNGWPGNKFFCPICEQDFYYSTRVIHFGLSHRYWASGIFPYAFKNFREKCELHGSVTTVCHRCDESGKSLPRFSHFLGGHGYFF